MKQKRYDPETRAAIIEAALSARKAGKTWDEALEAAKSAGFQGKRPRLVRFVGRGAGPAKKPGPRASGRPRKLDTQAPAKAQAAGAFRYDKAAKAQIIEAAQAARAQGQSWAEAFHAAKEEGYHGSLGGLGQMIRKAGSRKPAVPGRPKGAPAPARKGRPWLYDDATKAAIIKAALEARQAGKKWAAALQDAKVAGYRGGLIALVAFVKGAAGPAKKPGRKPARGTATVRAGGTDMAALQTVLDGMVKERIGAAIDEAIAVLKKMRCEV